MADKPVKAQRTTVQIGAIAVDGFMLPDGRYRMSQAQTAESVGQGRQNVSDFLRSNALKSLLGDDYTDQVSDREEVEIESTEGRRGQSRFLAVPLEVVALYWLWQAHRGNKKALALSAALIVEALERRFDAAFGVRRTEIDRNLGLMTRIEALQSDLDRLGDAFAIDDLLRQENQHLLRVLRENGIDPWVGFEGDDRP